MKKTITLLSALTFFTALTTFAQVPNGDFETLNYDGSLRNWGNVYLSAVMIDSNGVAHYDSIVWNGGNYYYEPTTDAHTGNYAMQLNNAWNYGLNGSIGGSASVDTDSVYSAYGALEFIPTQIQPTSLNFYYKYLPAGNDSAYVTFIVYDTMMNELGNANMTIGGTTGSYTLASSQVIYTAPGQVCYYSLNFSATVYGMIPGYGTKFIIDDITINGTTGIKDISDAIRILYPNPVTAFLRLDNSQGETNYHIYSADGKIISKGILAHGINSIPITGLTAGVYFIDTPGIPSRLKFIVAE
jgi:hypothetical protein